MSFEYQNQFFWVLDIWLPIIHLFRSERKKDSRPGEAVVARTTAGKVNADSGSLRFKESELNIYQISISDTSREMK